MTLGADSLTLGLGFAKQGTLLFSELLVAACLFAHGQPTKSHPVVRALAAVALVFVASLASVFSVGAQGVSDIAAVGMSSDTGLSLVQSLSGGLATCTLFLLITIPVLLACFEMSPWAATYCATRSKT
jgi:hypothetical protein